MAEKLYRGDTCECAGCLERFNSLAGFDLHRIGDFDKGTRRCRTVAEMKAKGMSKDARGYWITRAYDGPHGKENAA